MDFGISTCVRRRVLEMGPYSMTGMSGSLRYMAPEVANCEPYDESVDVYSFGMLMWQVLTGVTPFQGFKKEKFMLDVVQNHFRPDMTRVAALATDRRCCGETVDVMTSIVQRCWDPKRTRRPKMAAVYEQLCDIYSTELAMNAGCCA
jgi:serine/threonine protein kinase